jgi:predicted RND superfamily exporter protein
MARFGERSPLVIILDYPGVAPEVVNRLTDGLASRLRSWPEVVSVEAKVLDLAASEAAVLFRAALFNSGPRAVEQLAEKFTPKGMREELMKTRKTLLTIEDPSLRDLAAADVLNVRELVQPFFESRLANLKFSRLGEYFDSGETNARLVFVQPAGPAEDADFSADLIRKLDKLVAELKQASPGAAAIAHRFTGKHALAAETVDLMKKEMRLVTTLASLLVFFLVVAAFRRFRVILISFLPLSIALLAIFIVARFCFNPLNYLALSFASVILGLGDDVTVHLTVRLFQFMKKGHAAEEAARLTLTDCGPPVIINMSTTAAAFFCLIISDYRPVVQFGMLTGCGLLITVAVSFLLFPVMIRIFWSRKPMGPRGPAFSRLPRHLSALSLSRPVVSLAAALLIAGAGAFGARRFNFEMDMMKLVPKKLPALASGRDVSRLFGASFVSSLELTIEARDHAGAMRAQKALDEMLIGLVRQKKVAGFQSPSFILPWETDPRDRDGASQKSPGLAELVKDNKEEFFRLIQELRFRRSPELENYYRFLEEATSIAGSPLDALQAAGEILPRFRKFAAVEGGKIFLQTHVWPADDLDNLAAVKDVDGEFRDFTPPPGVILRRTSTYQVYEEINHTIRADFYRVSLLSFIVICGLLFLFFRRLSDVVICLLPAAGGIVATLGFIVFARLAFTPAEIGVSALLLGIGINYAVHIMARARSAEEGSISEVMREVGPAILLTSLTTIAGFASLMAATSAVTFTLGAVIAFGISACLLFTFLVVPAVQRLLRGR